jgi:hypothetical protein
VHRSWDTVKGNVDQSDHSLETVIKVRWYAKDKPLELCARSLGMLKDSVHLTVREETLDRLDEWKAANLRARQLCGPQKVRPEGISVAFGVQRTP